MPLKLPEADTSIIEDKKNIVQDLLKITKNIIHAEEEIKPYETDGLSVYRQKPIAVVLPETTEQVSKILKYCHQKKIKVVPRGAGTGLSGGSIPLADCILMGMGKFNKILETDFDNRCVVAQPCVANLAITQAVQHRDFYYAPDPSSQLACSIGGNVAENSGGVHSLKYGTTTNNLMGVEIVLMDGTILKLGGKHLDSEGYDLLGLVTGSEGLLGVVTEVTVRILKKPHRPSNHLSWGWVRLRFMAYSSLSSTRRVKSYTVELLMSTGKNMSEEATAAVKKSNC